MAIMRDILTNWSLSSAYNNVWVSYSLSSLVGLSNMHPSSLCTGPFSPVQSGQIFLDQLWTNQFLKSTACRPYTATLHMNMFNKLQLFTGKMDAQYWKKALATLYERVVCFKSSLVPRLLKIAWHTLFVHALAKIKIENVLKVVHVQDHG